jgi:hypothetical protein
MSFITVRKPHMKKRPVTSAKAGHWVVPRLSLDAVVGRE